MSLSLASDDFKAIQSARLVGNFRAPRGYVRHDLHKISQALGQSVYALSYALGSPKAVNGVGDTLQRSIVRQVFPIINRGAIGNRRAFWHVYEPGHVGQMRYRLFDIDIVNKKNRSEFTGDLKFRPSKIRVPLTERQTEPGKSGRRVTSRHVFINKAMVFEYGQPVTIRPRNAKMMVFDGNAKLIFMKTPITYSTSKSLMNNSLRSTVYDVLSNRGDAMMDELVSEGAKAIRSAERAAAVGLNLSMASDSQARAMAAAVADYLGV